MTSDSWRCSCCKTRCGRSFTVVSHGGWDGVVLGERRLWVSAGAGGSENPRQEGLGGVPRSLMKRDHSHLAGRDSDLAGDLKMLAGLYWKTDDHAHSSSGVGAQGV